MNSLAIRLLNLNLDIVCGINSGIPPCCIKYWVQKWMWIDWHNPPPWAVKRRKLGKGFGYVPCPKCLKSKKIVRLKDCLRKECPLGYFLGRGFGVGVGRFELVDKCFADKSYIKSLSDKDFDELTLLLNLPDPLSRRQVYEHLKRVAKNFTNRVGCDKLVLK